MSTSPTSIFNLAAESLAHIFAFLPPDERVRSERVSRQWRELVRKYGWIGFRTLTLNAQELKQEGDLALAKYRALLDRCAPYLRELSTASVDCNVKQWARMRNLRHLRFEINDISPVSSCTLRAVADNLKLLQSIHFSDINWRSVAVLHDLLRNASLQALHLPLSSSHGDSLCLPALSSSLRLLHLGARSSYNNSNPWERICDRVDELLELAASCCPQLGILMLPMYFSANETSLTTLTRFEKLFYLHLSVRPSHVELFGNSLAQIGPQLRALLLGMVNSRILQVIVEHCPLLEHISFSSIYHSSQPADAGGALLSALQSLSLLVHLRSLSIGLIWCTSDLRAQILDEIGALNAKGSLEYLHISVESPLSVEFVTKLIQLNPRLRNLACAIRHDHMPAQLDKLKMLLQNLDRPLELKLSQSPPELLEMVGNTRVRVQRFPAQRMIHPMLRQFWSRAMDSVPDLGYFDYC